MAKGGYEPIAPILFRRTHAQRLLLEYDDERSGSFEPLRHVPQDVIPVLGLITTKTPRRETMEALVARILEASRHLPLDQLAVSPQCGFSSSIAGNRLGLEDERYKLRLLVRVAREVWGTA